MPNTYFKFKQFTIHQDRCAMKVTTDGCLFGAWIAREVRGQKSKVRNALDIGTGTGLLSLMCVQENATVHIDAVEIDKDSFEQAKENMEDSPWSDRINILNADIKTYVTEKKYDVIICNPPFYENELQSPDGKRNTAHHSSNLTLHELLAIAKNLLAPGGVFYFLFPYKRKEEAEKLISTHFLYIHKTILVKQSLNHDFFRIMISGGLRQRENIKTKEMSIRNIEQQYTDDFIELLKDYYLHL